MVEKNWLEPEEKVLTYVDLLTETPTVRLKEKGNKQKNSQKLY